MKLTKIFGVVAVAVFGLMAFAAAASATTLETNGVKQTAEIETRWSLRSLTVIIFKDTSGVFANQCNASTLIGKDSTSKTGTTVSGPVSTLSFSSCTHEKVVVDSTGTVSAEWIKGTTNGTLRSSGMKVTVPVTIFGSVVTTTCTTENTDIGTLTGTASGSSTIDVNAVINCGSVLPSAIWIATFVLTTSEGKGHAIGVVE